RQTVGIPTSFSLYLVSFQGFIPAKYVFNGSCHHVMDPWRAVCRGWAFVKCKGGSTLPYFDRLVEHLLFFPEIEYFFGKWGVFEPFIFFVIHERRRASVRV